MRWEMTTGGCSESAQSRQTAERESGKRWKFIHPFAQGHREWRDLNPAASKLRVILEGRDLSSVVQRDRADGPAPELHLGDHGVSPQVHGFVTPARVFLPVARRRFRPSCFIRAIGPGVVSGSEFPNCSSMSSARQTRINPESWIATSPDSNRSTVRLDTPACSANAAWVKSRSMRAPARRPPNSWRTASSVRFCVIFINDRFDELIKIIKFIRQLWRFNTCDFYQGWQQQILRLTTATADPASGIGSPP